MGAILTKEVIKQGAKALAEGILKGAGAEIGGAAVKHVVKQSKEASASNKVKTSPPNEHKSRPYVER